MLSTIGRFVAIVVLAVALLGASGAPTVPLAAALPQKVDASQAKPTRESLAASASAVKARLAGPGRDAATPAWRTDLAAMVKEVDRIATTAKRPEKVELIDSDGQFRGAAMYFDSTNQPLWIGKHAGPADELHGALAAAFAGEFMWSGEMKSARVDPKTGDASVEILLARAESLPARMTLVEAVTLRVPAAAIPTEGLPPTGARVTVTGVLKDGPGEGVWVAYGVRSNLGKTQILVNAEAYSIEGQSRVAGSNAEAASTPGTMRPRQTRAGSGREEEP